MNIVTYDKVDAQYFCIPRIGCPGNSVTTVNGRVLQSTFNVQDLVGTDKETEQEDVQTY